MGALPGVIPTLSYGVQLGPSTGRRPRFLVPLSSAATSSAPVVTRGSEMELENRKFELLRAVLDTQRGLVATSSQRSSIEEAMVNVESFDPGNPINYRQLDGTWRLQYTSAPDVLILFQAAASLPFLNVGQVFQKFECQDQSNKGIVRNIVRWSVPGLLEDQEGASLVVSADFSVVSKRNIQLEFQKVAVQSISISEELQALLAPALLPRSFFNLQVLQFIKSFTAEVPVTTAPRQSVGGLYYLSFLDNNMLLGRSVGGGGAFVFSRSQPLIL